MGQLRKLLGLFGFLHFFGWLRFEIRKATLLSAVRAVVPLGFVMLDTMEDVIIAVIALAPGMHPAPALLILAHYPLFVVEVLLAVSIYIDLHAEVAKLVLLKGFVAILAKPEEQAVLFVIFTARPAVVVVAITLLRAVNISALSQAALGHGIFDRVGRIDHLDGSSCYFGLLVNTGLGVHECAVVCFVIGDWTDFGRLWRPARGLALLRGLLFNYLFSSSSTSICDSELR